MSPARTSCPSLDRERHHHARHRAEQELRGVGLLLDQHQRRKLGLALGQHPDRNLDALIGDVIAVEDRADLHEGGLAVDGPLPHRIAEPPIRGEIDRLPPALEDDRERPLDLARDRDPLGGTGDLDDAHFGELHRLAVHLLGDGAAALIAHMVDGGGDGDDRVALLAGRQRRLEASGKFLGDELGGEPSLPPALVAHQHGEEGNVVAEAVDGEGVERARPYARWPRAASARA